VVSKRTLEAKIGRQVEAFAWVGGEETAYSAEAARAIRGAGFKLVFATNNRLLRRSAVTSWVERTNVEAGMTLSEVAMQLSGALDLVYWAKRRRLKRRIGGYDL